MLLVKACKYYFGNSGLRGAITMPMPDKNEKKKPLVFYSVIYRKYDSLSQLHGKLYHVRYAYLEEDTYGRRVVDDICDGVDTRWVYNISKRGLKWKKTKGGKVVQRSVPEAKGYGVVTIGNDGSIVSNTVFDDKHQWVHNYYYMNDDLLTPYIIIEPAEHENALYFLEYDKMCGKYSKKKLHACPIAPGTAVQSMVNHELGEPEICAATSEGDFCYCSETECNRRLSLAQSIRQEENGMLPKWEGLDMDSIAPEEPDFDPDMDVSKYNFNFTPEQMGIDALYDVPNGFEAKQESSAIAPLDKTQSDLDENHQKPFADFETLLNSDLSDEEIEELEKANLMALEESKKKLQLAKCETTDLKNALPSGQPKQSAAYSSNRELYHVEDVSNLSTANSEITESAVEQESDRICQISENGIQAEQNVIPQEKIEVTTAEDGNKNSRYTVAVQKANGKTFCTQEVLKHTIPAYETSTVKNISATKRIVVSEEESYLYFGRLIDGLRQGHGRTEMESGHTAYEGYYRDDKRDGFGAYYYKSGQICYVGDWKENQRDGIGVSYTPHGENIHVGRWSENKPVGTGAIFDEDGNLSFAGRIENGIRQGVGISYKVEDGTIFVGKWKDNVPTGKGSEFDQDGNLIYTGMWKDGKRHGFGTEYNKDGTIVFTGEWENDKYLDGVLYQKIVHDDGKKTEIDF